MTREQDTKLKDITTLIDIAMRSASELRISGVESEDLNEAMRSLKEARRHITGRSHTGRSEP